MNSCCWIWRGYWHPYRSNRERPRICTGGNPNPNPNPKPHRKATALLETEKLRITNQEEGDAITVRVEEEQQGFTKIKSEQEKLLKQEEELRKDLAEVREIMSEYTKGLRAGDKDHALRASILDADKV